MWKCEETCNFWLYPWFFTVLLRIIIIKYGYKLPDNGNQYVFIQSERIAKHTIANFGKTMDLDFLIYTYYDKGKN